MESSWCYETEFRSLMAWGKKLLLSLSVFAIMLRKHLPDGSKMKRRLLGWFESLILLTALFFSVWGRCPAEREEQTLRCAQLSAQLSARLCSPDWSRLHSTLRYTFYGPWIESFQDCWRDPEFPQLSQMVQSLPGFLNLCYKTVFPLRCLQQVSWSCSTSPQGSHWS